MTEADVWSAEQFAERALAGFEAEDDPIEPRRQWIVDSNETP
jgi:hypothetical protein